ncbi:PAS domain S-box protein [Mycoplasmatota bacterium WC30]
MTENFFKDIVYKSSNGYAYHEMIFDESGKAVDYRFIEVNPAFEKITGLKSAGIIGKTILEVLPEIKHDDFDWIAFYGDVVQNSKEVEFESYSTPLSSWYKINAYSPEKNHFITIFRDSSENRKTEMELEEMSSIFSNAIKEAPIPIMIHREDGTIIKISDAWTDISGYSQEDIPTINEWTKKAYGSQQDEVRDFVNKLYHLNERQHDGEFLVNTKSNEKLLWDFYSTYLGKTKDGYKMAMSVAIDVTERQKLLNNLKYEHDKSQQYLDVAGVMLIVLDNEGNISNINEKGCEILEAKENELIGKNWFDNFISEEIRDNIKKVFSNVFNKSEDLDLHFENEIITAMGKKKIINWYNTVIYDTENNVTGVLSSGEDITEKKEYEKALFASNQRFEKLFDKAPFGYQSLDINGNFIEVNNTWLNTMGYQKDEVIGKWFGDFLPQASKEEFKKRFKIFKEKGKIHSTFQMLRKNGDKVLIEFEGLIGYDENQQFAQTYCNLNDITKRKEIEEQLLMSESNLKLAQSIAKIGSWEINLVDGSMWASKEAFKIYEIDEESGFVDITSIQTMVDKDDREKLDIALEELINNNKPYDVVFKLHTKDRNIKYINSRAILFTDSKNKPVKVIGVIHDISDLKYKELELVHLSQRDYLTNLYNRRYYFEQFKLLNNPRYYPLGVMMLDLNGLKIINDAFGHSAGDFALKTIGDVLKDSFEDKDVVSRIGGDEFTVLLPNTSSEKLQYYKEEIIKIVKTKSVDNIELSIAIGYELKNNINEKIDDIQKSAENRMYRHKTTEGSSVRSKAINAILHTLSEKYEAERRHSNKVSELCKEIGIKLNLREDEIKELEQAGLFHDIGKISIPDSILNKPGKLTFDEFEVIKSHTEVGYQILRAADEYSDLAIQALHHHERWDGKGYPNGMKGEEIPLFSRIICVVDAYEAMTADRPYRKKLSNEYAKSEIKKYAGTQFDPKISKIFVEQVLE